MTNFPGFQLFDFLAAIDKLLAPLTNKKIVRELIYYDTLPPLLHFQLHSEDYDSNEGIIIMRTFSRNMDQLVVEHDIFRLPASARHNGVGKEVLQISLEQYKLLGVNKIVVHAGLEDGGLIWAKVGFNAPNKAEVDNILEDARLELSDRQFLLVKRIYDNYYGNQPDGKAFPLVKWTKLDGMDVLNTDDLTNLKNYVTRQE